MDLATLTSLVGLFSMWKGERSNTEQGKHQTFLEYLDTHRFDQLKSMLEGNTDLLSEIQMQSDSNHAEIMSALELSQQASVEMLSKMENFQWVAKAIKSNDQKLSPQAMRILSGLYSSDYDDVIISQSHDGWSSTLNPDPITKDDECFLEDDLEILETAGLLRISVREHCAVIKKTRQGLDFAEKLPKPL